MARTLDESPNNASVSAFFRWSGSLKEGIGDLIGTVLDRGLSSDSSWVDAGGNVLETELVGGSIGVPCPELVGLGMNDSWAG